MALNITPKAKSNPSNPQPVATPPARPQVNYGKPTTSSARVAALKDKLSKAPPPTPQAPRRAGSSARAEEYAALQKFPTPQPQGRTSARQEAPTEFPPQPSGLAPGAVAPELSQSNNNVEPPAQVEATSQPLSPQFVALAKQEKAIRRARQELKMREDALKQREAEYVPKSLLTSDPLKALTEAGVTYDRLVELQLNQVAPDPNQALLDKIASLEARLAGVDEQFTKRDSQQYDAAVNQIRRDAKLLVDSDPAFETIKATGQTEHVVELIKQVFNAEGEVLPVEEAARLVEEKLVDREFKRFESLGKLAKIKSRLAPPAEIPEEASPLQPQPKQTTLTNQGSVQRALTARERAIMAVEKRMAEKG